MIVVLLIAGIGFFLVGLVTAGFGLALDLSFGNTLILAGAIVTCTGTILIGLWTAVRELKYIALRLGPGISAEPDEGTALPGMLESGGFLFSRGRSTEEDAGVASPAAASPALSAAPWREEATSRSRARTAAPEPVEAAPAVEPRRNLLFSSSSRKERERAEARTAEPSASRPPDPGSLPRTPESGEVPPPSFDDGWPKSERSRTFDTPPMRRPGRAPSTFTEPNAPAGGTEDQAPVTVLKSGVVEGMAYSLYSDGSIEAQMPEGMMRFASIDDLRSHLDHRS
jgi:hypothetical protein